LLILGQNLIATHLTKLDADIWHRNELYLESEENAIRSFVTLLKGLITSFLYRINGSK
jgi:hypothetical protein